MEDKKIFLRHFDSQYHIHLEILTWYRSEIGWSFDSGKNSIHTVPFILTCAAALECSLNDHIMKHLTSEHGEHGKLQIPGFLSMNLKGKLLSIVPLLTMNKYMLSVEHKVYQKLSELIKIRNRLVHNKSSYEIFEATLKESSDGTPFIPIPDGLNEKLSSKIDPTFGINEDIGIYHDSLEQFHELFFDVYSKDDYKGNDLIIEMSKGNDISFVMEPD